MQLYPECTSGNNTTLIQYKDELCAQIDPTIWTDNSTCIHHLPYQSVPAAMFACDTHAGDPPQTQIPITVSASYTTAPASTATTPSPSQDPDESLTGSTSTSLITSATSGSPSPPISSQVSPSGGTAAITTRNFREQVRSHWVSFFRSMRLGLPCWRDFFSKPWKKSEE